MDPSDFFTSIIYNTNLIILGIIQSRSKETVESTSKFETCIGWKKKEKWRKGRNIEIIDPRGRFKKKKKKKKRNPTAVFSRSCDLDLDPTRAGERASEAPWARGISRSRRVREKRIDEERERERWGGSIRSVGRISGTGQTLDEGPAKIKASFDNNGTIPDVLDLPLILYFQYPLAFADGQVLFFFVHKSRGLTQQRLFSIVGSLRFDLFFFSLLFLRN